MASEQLTDAVRTKNAMEALVASEGWEMFDEDLRTREANLLTEFLKDGADYSDAKLREFRIGLKLIRTIRMTPAVMIESSGEVITQFAYEEEEEQSHGEEEGSGHPDDG